MLDVNTIIGEILVREGWPAYTNHAADRGGPTKGGITLAAWREYSQDPGATADELAALNEAQARLFYMYRHVVEPKFHRIEDPALCALVVDAGVHHGVRHATKWLQWAADVKQDGSFGPKTEAAVNGADPREVYLWLVSMRIRLFGRLIGRDPELARAQQAGFNLQARWAGGWNNRAAEFIEALARKLEEQHNAEAAT